jgi:D-sedoheptulose 7-phosphate isomerase
MADRMKDFIAGEFDSAQRSFQRLAQDAVVREQLVAAALSCVGALRAGGKLLFAGNGGSAADAQHWAAELVGKFSLDRPGLAALALTTDSSILTAVGNDLGYERVFARQLEALGVAGDVFVAISTSGRSPNILAAAKVAKARGLHVIGFTGEGGGELRALCDTCFCIPATDTPRIQEGHEFVGHLLCALVEQEMFGNAAG